MKDNKLYEVELTYGAEGMATGYVNITRQEYEFLKWVTNTNNWKDLLKEPYCGYLDVYCEELEKENQHATKS